MLAVYSLDQFSGVPAYRWVIPFSELQRRGYKADYGHVQTVSLLDQRTGFTGLYDIVVLHHVLYEPEVLAQMRALGLKLVGDMDDDYTDRHRQVNPPDVVERLWRQVSLMDAMTVSTEEVKSLLVEMGFPRERVFICPNLLEIEHWQGWERSPAPTIGLSGGSSHYNDWKVVPEAVAQVLEEEPEWHFFLSGFLPGYLLKLKQLFPERVHVNPQWVSYEVYPGVVAKMDIGLCPVDPADPFNDKKTPIKALELMAAGGVPVCSDHPIYRGVVAHGVNGLLVEHSPEGFYRGIKAAIAQHAQLLPAAQSYVRKHWDVRQRYTEWLDAYRAIYHLPRRAL